MKHQWLIRGFDGLTKIFETKVSLGQVTDDQMKQMLRALTDKAGLEYHEIVGAYAKRGTKIANNLLTVQRDSTTATFSCGDNIHFSASVIDEDGKVIRYPRLP
jgi:hypothetical protein